MANLDDLSAQANTSAAPRDVTAGLPTSTSQEHLAAIVEWSLDAVIGQDLNGLVTSWNAGAEALFGYRAEEMLGMPLTRLIPDDRQHEEDTILDQWRRGDRIERLDTLRQTRDGRLIDVSVTVSPIRDAGGRVIGGSKIARDITALKQAERETARMSRLYAALSQVNQAIVWTPNRDDLFRKVCRVLVEHGGLRMAWIGWDDPRTHRLVPVAEFGDLHGYLQSLEIYSDERPQGQGPCGKAYRSGQPHLCNDLFTDPATLPWRPSLERSGFLACAAFPIRAQGMVCGTLSVYADRRDFFHDKEIALLAEAAVDISFALDNFARDAARRQAEQTLRHEMLFSDTMLESMPGIVYFYDAAGHFLRWNRNFEAVSGYSGREIAGMHPLDFFLPDDRELLTQRIAEVFTTGESSVEAAFVSRDGHTTPFFFTGRRVEFQDKTCLVGVGIDISERKRAETALRDAELRFHTLFEQTPAGVVVVDPETASIIECNEQAARQLGYTHKELIGLAVADIEANDTSQEIRQRIAQLFAEARNPFETRHRTKSGDVRDVLVSGRLIELAGRKLVHCVLFDITERLRIEAEREQRHRAEAADRIKSAFLATMSHELRTPLNAIIGFTSIVVKGMAGPLNAEQGKQLGMVQTSAHHLLALVNDVLDISKIEAGQLDVASERFDLRQSIDKVITLVTPQAQAKGLALHVRVAPTLGEAVSDQRRFEQILLNLLSNAVKFTEQGQVTLAADLMAGSTLPAVAPRPACVRLQVTDSGIGIRPEDLPTLFQPFRQIDSGLSRQHDGTGLGLAICQRLAALMGGEIRAESQWGKGSTFIVTLPLKGPVPP